MKSRTGILIIISVVVFAGAYVFLSRPALPPAISYPSPTPLQTRTSTPIASPSMPSAVNLDIPFVSQAPKMIWDADHEEFCEEAAALMAASYVSGDRSVTDPNTADTRLYAIKAWEMAHLGHFEDTTAAETLRILKEDLGVAKAQIVTNPSEADIRSWLAQGRAVLVPAAGQELGNPNFTAPGPVYHMIILKGYTAGGMFIVNDPGTRKGANYLYSPEVIMHAMHDWNGGADIDQGRKVVIVVG